MKNILIILTLTLALFSCNEENTNQPSNIHNKGKALILVVENLDIMNADEEELEKMRPQLVDLFSNLFKVDKQTIANMPILDVIDIYGEEYIINSCKEIIADKYDRIITLTDEDTDSKIFIDSINELINAGYIVDIVLNMHGTENKLSFNDKLIDIEDIIKSIEKSNRIRVVYQTCCYGKSTIENWEAIGVSGINGAEALNSVTIFASRLFLEHWISGKTYYDCVNEAYKDELKMYDLFKTLYPELTNYIDNIDYSGSKQFIGGTNYQIKF